MILAHSIPVQGITLEGYVLISTHYGISGLAGVTVSATPGGGSFTTSSSGHYVLSVPYGWSGYVTPYKAGYRFSPASEHYVNVVCGHEDVFDAYPIGCVIGGFVRTADGAGFPGVAVSLDVGGSTETDSSGYYSLTTPYNWIGTVTPSKPGWIFGPPSRSYSNLVTNKTSENYVAMLPGYHAISGHVSTADGAGLQGARVSASNGAGLATTDAIGYYGLAVPDGWTGVVTVAKAGFALSPGSRSYDHIVANRDNEDYAAMRQGWGIGGYIRTATGAGLAEVVVSTSNGGGSATTDSSGYYGLTVPEGWSGTVTPSKAGYAFTPAPRSYDKVTTDQNGQDYTGRLCVVVYVDAGARGKNDGTSWASALVYLQDALAKALPGDTLRVAEGWYWPDLGVGQNIGDRAATFQLKNGLVIYGGFPTGGGEGPQCNPRVHQTILSGDIGKTGVATDNSYHVVSANGLSIPVLLDGCVIAGGYANVVLPTPRKDQGAGLYSVQSRLQVRNCIFVGNTATGQGGAAYAATSDVTFLNCLFTGNTASDGGALYNEPGTVALINCTIVANQGLCAQRGTPHDRCQQHPVGQSRPPEPRCLR